MHRSTVVIPIFNRAPLAARCIQAVLENDPCHVLAVDDASTDETPRLLAGFGDRIGVVRHATNLGFSQSCNDGAAAAQETDFLAFLNSDALPEPGWLRALERHADAHPGAAAVGSRLLYPDGTVQHAGVVIGQDREPRHLYAGFPGSHPAVNRSRRFQAVTAACVLVRRETFQAVGGFDTSFRNGLEDVDLCLRLGQMGNEIHYCHESVARHLESVSDGRFRHQPENIELFRARWKDHLQPDDLSYYLADGLLHLDYDGTYPIHMRVSPLLATLSDRQYESEAIRLLQLRTRQVFELLRANIGLAAELGAIEFPTDPVATSPPAYSSAPLPAGELKALLVDAQEQLLQRDHGLQAQIADMQAALGNRNPGQSDVLDYQAMIDRVRSMVREVLPVAGPVIVISKGDNALLNLDGRTAWHFPQTSQGTYAGHHPGTSEEAISHIESLRAQGGRYLLIPRSTTWMLDHFDGFRLHLNTHYDLLADREGTGMVYALETRRDNA